MPADALVRIKPQMIRMPRPDLRQRQQLRRLERRMPRRKVLVPIERNPLPQQTALKLQQRLARQVRMRDPPAPGKTPRAPPPPRRSPTSGVCNRYAPFVICVTPIPLPAAAKFRSSGDTSAPSGIW